MVQAAAPGPGTSGSLPRTRMLVKHALSTAKAEAQRERMAASQACSKAPLQSHLPASSWQQGGAASQSGV